MLEETSRKEILNIITNKNFKKGIFPKLTLTICLIIIIFMISMGLVFAKEVKGFFSEIIKLDNQSEKYHLYGNDYVKIKEEISVLPGKGTNTIMELEELLGIKFLKNDKVKNETLVNYEFVVTNNKFGKAKFEVENYMDFENKEDSQGFDKKISVNISFITQFATENDIENFKEGIKANGSNIEMYHIDELNIDAYIFNRRPMTGIQTTWFAYNNMLYSLQGSNMTTDEMIEIVRTLK